MEKAKQPKSDDQKFEEWATRTAREFVRKGGNKSAIFLKERGQDPIVDALNEVFRQERRRKIN